MNDTPGNGSERLDSWKAIAAYLGRDERTVQRWERQLGLPVRRVPGGRGRSVFAYSSEIDKWLTTKPQEALPPPTPIPSDRRVWLAAALLIVGIGLGWLIGRPTASESPLRVEFRPSAFVGFDHDGTEAWRYSFPPDEIAAVPDERASTPADIVSGRNPVVLAATSHWARKSDDSIRSGQLFQLSPRGGVQRTFGFDDRLTFDAGPYAAPWGITDFRVTERAGVRRVALAAHHFQWWPSMVTILDEHWERRGTFVNAGWLERVRWLSPDRLLVAGFSEAYDAGVVAILDANALNGQAPVPDGSRFACRTCGPDRPLRYIVMPRSEVNRTTGSRFNRALVQLAPGRAVIRTVEVPSDTGDAVDAIYEFTPALDLIRSSFSERYWDLHRRLEAEGKLNHARDQCPDREGPRQIQVWEPGSGWRTIAAH